MRIRNACIVRIALVFVAPWSFCAADSECVNTYERLHERVTADDEGGALDNVSGTVAWGSSYQLDSYLNMYEATRDPLYLKRYVKLADRVLAARADKTGTLDYRGRLTYGWLSGGHYTLGTPTVLVDREGNPSLEIRTIANSYNTNTAVAVVSEETGPRFTITVTNTRNPDRPVELGFSNLTIDTAETLVNPAPGKSGYLRVRRLGDNPPIDYDSFTPPTELMTFHGHHTGRIVTSFARFCALILKGGGPDKFTSKAKLYLSEIRVTMVEHDQFFIEEDDYGYTIFEKGSPFWCDGAPEVHNTMAASGSVYVYLYAATGEPYYLDRATRLARLFKRHHIPEGDESWMFYYWWGLMHDGWKAEDKVSENLPVYSGAKTAADISHFQLTLSFLIDCYEHGIVFAWDDLRKWANTFKRTIYRKNDGEPYLAYRVNGDQSGKDPGASNHVIYGFTRLGSLLDPDVLAKCRGIYEARYLERAAPTTLLGWSVFAKAEALASKN